MYIIIDTQQIEGKSTDESSPHYCVYIWLERIKVGAGKHNFGRAEFRVGNKIAYLLLSKTMTGELSVGGLLQAVYIYSNVQTQAKLVCIMYNMLMHIMSDLCVLTTQ